MDVAIFKCVTCKVKAKRNIRILLVILTLGLQSANRELELDQTMHNGTTPLVSAS